MIKRDPIPPTICCAPSGTSPPPTWKFLVTPLPIFPVLSLAHPIDFYRRKNVFNCFNNKTENFCNIHGIVPLSNRSTSPGNPGVTIHCLPWGAQSTCEQGGARILERGLSSPMVVIANIGICKSREIPTGGRIAISAKGGEGYILVPHIVVWLRGLWGSSTSPLPNQRF